MRTVGGLSILAGDIVVAVLWRRDAAFVSLVMGNKMVVSVQCTRQDYVEGIVDSLHSS